MIVDLMTKKQYSESCRCLNISNNVDKYIVYTTLKPSIFMKAGSKNLFTRIKIFLYKNICEINNMFMFKYLYNGMEYYRINSDCECDFMAGSKFKMYENLVFLTQIGISMVIPILGGLLIGKFIDEKVGTNSIFMLSFIVLGVVVAFMNVYKMVMRDYRKKDK